VIRWDRAQWKRSGWKGKQRDKEGQREGAQERERIDVMKER